MKALTATNWFIVSLHVLFFIYMVVANASPNNDAAGRGMMGGILILLFILGAIVIGLNLANSLIAKIIALVLGALPVLVISITLITESQQSSSTETDYTQEDQSPTSQIQPK